MSKMHLSGFGMIAKPIFVVYFYFVVFIPVGCNNRITYSNSLRSHRKNPVDNEWWWNVLIRRNGV